jgi:hypothetical protein
MITLFMLLKYYNFGLMDEENIEYLFELYSFYDYFPISDCEVALSINKYPNIDGTSIDVFIDYEKQTCILENNKIRKLISHIEQYLNERL